VVRAGAALTPIGAGGVCETKPRDVRPTEVTPSSNIRSGRFAPRARTEVGCGVHAQIGFKFARAWLPLRLSSIHDMTLRIG